MSSGSFRADAIAKHLLSAARKQRLALVVGQLELIRQCLGSLDDRMLLAASTESHQRQHDGLEVGCRHTIFPS